MKSRLVMLSIAGLACAATISAAPGQGAGQGAGQRDAKPPQAQKQTQPREQKAVEEQVRVHRDEAEGKAARAEEQVRTREMREGDSAGDQRSAEMQARQQERKEIHEEYKEAARSGEGEKVKGKKPWWKFWGD